MKEITFTFFLLIAMTSCTQADLSTPEKNHETYVRAFKMKNYDLWLKCFADVSQMNKEFIANGLDPKESIQRMFDKINIRESKIIERRSISDTDAALVIREVFDRYYGNSKYLITSTYRVRYVKMGDQWRIKDKAEQISLEGLKWQNGKYVPIEIRNSLERSNKPIETDRE